MRLIFRLPLQWLKDQGVVERLIDFIRPTVDPEVSDARIWFRIVSLFSSPLGFEFFLHVAVLDRNWILFCCIFWAHCQVWRAIALTMGKAHTRFIDASDIHVFTHRIWAPPLAEAHRIWAPPLAEAHHVWAPPLVEAQRYSASNLLMHSKNAPEYYPISIRECHICRFPPLLFLPPPSPSLLFSLCSISCLSSTPLPSAMWKCFTSCVWYDQAVQRGGPNGKPRPPPCHPGKVCGSVCLCVCA